MNKTKVIVMSFKGRQTVTYTDNGQFIYIPRKKHHQVGQILSIDTSPAINQWFNPGWKSLVAAAAVMLFFFGLFYPLTSQQAEAYFSLGLNKGNTELWVDKDNRVIDVKYSGAVQLESLNVKGKDVYQAISEITTEAKKTGLLDEDKENLMLVSYTDMSKGGSHQFNEDKMKQAVLKSVNYKNMPLMVMSRQDKEYMAKAGEMGLTTSQYYVLEQGKSKGLPLTAEQLMHTPIRAALKEVGTTPEELFDMQGMHKNTADHRAMMPKGSKLPTTSLPDNNTMERTHRTMPNGTHLEKQSNTTPMQDLQQWDKPEQDTSKTTMMEDKTQSPMQYRKQ